MVCHLWKNSNWLHAKPEGDIKIAAAVTLHVNTSCVMHHLQHTFLYNVPAAWWPPGMPTMVLATEVYVGDNAIPKIALTCKKHRHQKLNLVYEAAGLSEGPGRHLA